MMKPHEEKYVDSVIDTDAVIEEAQKIYAQRLKSSRHREYSPVIVRRGTLAGRDLLISVEGKHIDGYTLL